MSPCHHSCFRNRTMRTVTNYFIVNLAVADFLVILICLPPTVLWDVTDTWFMGTLACKIVLYLQVSVVFCHYEIFFTKHVSTRALLRMWKTISTKQYERPFDRSLNVVTVNYHIISIFIIENGYFKFINGFQPNAVDKLSCKIIKIKDNCCEKFH